MGSRSIPNDIFVLMREMAFYLGQDGWTLRSGGAEGSDFAFETGCDECGGKKEIFLPWVKFNSNNSLLYSPSAEAEVIAEKYHPNWPALNKAARQLMSRNVHQILGEDLQSPVKMVVCWTKDGKSSGGTGQAIRIAEDKKIPIFNLQIPTDRARIEIKLKIWQENWKEHTK